MEGEIEDLGPGAAAGGGRCVLVLLAPDENLAIVGGGGEDGAELGVCLGEESVMAIEKWEGGTGGGGVHTHATHHTAPSCLWITSAAGTSGEMDSAHPFRVSTSRCVSPSISNILTVLSEEHVANRRP